MARLEGAYELDPIVSVKVQRFFFPSSKLGICSIVTFCPFDSRDRYTQTFGFKPKDTHSERDAFVVKLFLTPQNRGVA